MKFRLFHDKVFIGKVAKDLADFPSIHCTIEIASFDEEPMWGPMIDRYRALCTQHHQLMQDRQLAEATALEPELLDAAAPFGDHLWFLVNTDTGQSTKINRPYFGMNNYLRFSYARSKVTFDPKKWQARMLTRFVLMTGSVASACEDLEKPALKEHLNTLAKLSGVLARSSAQDADLNDLTDCWFRELQLLDTSLTIFKNPGDRRHLDQDCAMKSPSSSKRKA